MSPPCFSYISAVSVRQIPACVPLRSSALIRAWPKTALLSRFATFLSHFITLHRAFPCFCHIIAAICHASLRIVTLHHTSSHFAALSHAFATHRRNLSHFVTHCHELSRIVTLRRAFPCFYHTSPQFVTLRYALSCIVTLHHTPPRFPALLPHIAATCHTSLRIVTLHHTSSHFATLFPTDVGSSSAPPAAPAAPVLLPCILQQKIDGAPKYV